MTLAAAPLGATTRPLAHRLAKRLKGLPRILRTRPVFALCRYLRYRGAHPTAPTADIRETLATLERDGVAILEGMFAADRVAAMAAEVLPMLDRVKAGNYDGSCPSYAYPDYGTYKLLEIDKAAPSTAAFFENSLIERLARSYVGGEAVSYQRMAELRPDVGRMSVSDIPHFDDWKHRFKVFLYLEDVDESNAPYVYYKRSHRPGDWRKDREYAMFRDGPHGSYGHIFPHEMDAINRVQKFERKPCVGKAGTLVITDTRGVHSGSVLRQGRRLVLANFFSN